MKLVEARVEMYKSIEDSEPWKVNQVTCFVGKNEAGKSALLEALHKLNPEDSSQGEFAIEDYPRRFVVSEDGGELGKTDNVITTKWVLDDEDRGFVKQKFSEIDLEPEFQVVATKGYDNQLRWNVPLNQKHIVSAILKRARLDATESSGLKTCVDIESMVRKLKGMQNKTEKQNKLEAELATSYQGGSAADAVGRTLKERLPKFLYFKEYYRLPGRVSITDLVARRSDPSRYTIEYKVFEALLNLVGSNAEDFSKSERSEELIMQLEGISNRLTGTIFKYWTQNRHLRVLFSFDHARPNDPAPFNEGWVFSTRIRNERHQASVPFELRSTGFIWFFSFLIWFSDVRRTYGDNILILLDEPGLTLHGKAQKDLVSYINAELRPKFQVLYTTHSPFMIDSENPFDLRTVQDVVDRIGKGDDAVDMIRGTKVSDKILSRDPDTVLPLLGVAGFDIAQTMFVGPYVVVVEGPSEYAYFRWFSRVLTGMGREGLDLRWAIAPAESSSKVTSFVSLFSGRGLGIAALMDYHEGQKNMVRVLEESRLLAPGHLLKTTDFCDKPEADIEDLIGWEMYRHLVNESMRLHPQDAINDSTEAVDDRRIVKFVEEKFRTMPHSVEEFGHYKPADYLIGIGKESLDSLPGLNEALDRFEALFRKLNGLIS